MVKVCNCKKTEFVNLTKEKQIIAICAGKDFLNFCEEYNIVKKIKYVVDNNKKGEIIVNNHSIEIISFDKLHSVVTDNSIFVLTSLLYADELIRQLDMINEINNVNTYIPQLFESTSSNDSLIAYSTNAKIPKKIHYCWFGDKEIPDQFKQYMETWYKKCPEYEIIRWDEKNYDVTKNRYMYEAYKCKKWGFVPDYARLDIVYNHGGFYLDTDVELLQSLDKLRGYEFCCGFESKEYVALGLGFGAVRGNKDILNMMKMYDDMKFILDSGELNQVASPKYQTEYLLSQGLVTNGKQQIINGGVILPIEWLCPVDPLGNGEPNVNSISIHHYAGTWFDEMRQNQKNRKIKNRKLLLDRIRL